MNLLSSVIGFALTLPLAFQVTATESSILFSITNAAFPAAQPIDAEIATAVWMSLGTMSFQPLFHGDAAVTAFSNHVADIVTVGPEKKVIRITTPGMIAPVTDADVLRDGTDRKLICHSVAKEGFASNTKLSIALTMCRPRPRPAPSRNDSHFGPEALHTVQRTSLFNSSQRAQV